MSGKGKATNSTPDVVFEPFMIEALGVLVTKSTKNRLLCKKLQSQINDYKAKDTVRSYLIS